MIWSILVVYKNGTEEYVMTRHDRVATYRDKRIAERDADDWRQNLDGVQSINVVRAPSER